MLRFAVICGKTYGNWQVLLWVRAHQCPCTETSSAPGHRLLPVLRNGKGRGEWTEMYSWGVWAETPKRKLRRENSCAGEGMLWSNEFSQFPFSDISAAFSIPDSCIEHRLCLLHSQPWCTRMGSLVTSPMWLWCPPLAISYALCSSVHIMHWKAQALATASNYSC